MTDNTSRIANHYVAVLVILTALGAFSLIQGAVYVVPVIVALLVGVALQDKRTIFLCRWLFGLAAVFGPMLFFNAYLLADFAKGGDWSRVLLISGAWFVVFEAICLTTFVSCGKLRANKIELWSRAGE